MCELGTETALPQGQFSEPADMRRCVYCVVVGEGAAGELVLELERLQVPGERFVQGRRGCGGDEESLGDSEAGEVGPGREGHC